MCVLWALVDVTRVQQLVDLADQARRRWGHIDVLVNNAGIMPISLMSQGRVDDWSRMVGVNIKGVLHGIHAVLEHMLARSSGHIINISLVAGLSVGPGSAVYSGTKFAVRAISEGLRQECAGKLRVTSICLGLVSSELTDSITLPAFKERAQQLYAGAMSAEVIAEPCCMPLHNPRMWPSMRSWCAP